jgi:hypothetical protein
MQKQSNAERTKEIAEVSRSQIDKFENLLLTNQGTKTNIWSKKAKVK